MKPFTYITGLMPRSWHGGRSVVAVLLQRDQDGSWTAHGLVLHLRQGRVTIADRWRHVRMRGPVPEKLPNGMPYVLVVDGRGVLHKPVPPNAAASPAERLREALPGVVPKDFYLQVAAGAETDFLSLIRCDTFDPVWDEWQAAGHWVVGASLGPWAAAFLAPVLEPAVNGQATMPAGHYDLAVKDGRPLSAVPAQAGDETLALGGESLGRHWVPAYAAGLAWLLTGGTSPSPAVEKAVRRQAEWRQRKRFEAAGKGLLLGIFVLLLANFLILSHLRQRIGRAETLANRSSVSLEKEKEMLRQMLRKKAFFEQNGWLRGTRHSFLADTLAAGLPPGIRLLELAIHPEDGREGRREKRMVFVPDMVVAKGVCASPGPLQAWMHTLEGSEWVEAVEEPQYQFDPQLQAGVFTVTIRVK